MGRARKPPPALHRHCEGCFNRHCHVPVEPSVSCLVISCHLLCGATFHMCKESEHTLLCPLEQVPCLNSEYGCPLSMARHKLAKHLQVCPASVVCCSMEWIRWPNVDSETFLHENISVEDLPKSDLIKTTLQCALERELKGHVISESRSIDGLFMDLATQTYNFEPEQFSSETVLADLLGTAQPGGLHVELHSECVTRRHNKSSSAFTFTCNKFFRRDEFPLHFKNVHTDIQSSLDGWFQHRCPLAYLGCTFVQNHFRPPGQKAKVIYSQELKTFAIKPEVAPELSEKWKSDHLSGRDGKSLNSLTSLPLEVLQYIAGFLDSISLSQLSQVSVLMRNICATLLQERGMVLSQWKKKRYSHGGTSWKVHNQIWQFSSLFSKINSWEFNDVTSMSEHLKTCPFNIVERKTDPIRLTSMCQPQEKARESLVSTFRARPRGRHF